ncbi:SHIPPO_1-like protein [Hexamita inflata]|uniref:SHIPPO 1-like protein n=1 Tax=Hexamita inflata TaxID=28002 RepID=A0AA86UXW0_9EUKA|nr:SHIPPO 1-like protein [Hexamita inflata]
MKLEALNLSKTGTMFDRVSTDAPGPNKYSTTSGYLKTKQSIPQISMLFSRTPEHHENVPGPNEYDIERSTKLTSRNAPRFTLRPKTRSQSAQDYNLGPGEYNVNISTLRRTGAGTMGGRNYGQSTQLNGPSACEYNKDKAYKAVKKSTPQITMGQVHTTAFEPPKDQLPGVGSYNISSRLQTSGAGRFARQNTNHKAGTDAPGVGSYSVSGTEKFAAKKAPSYSMGSRHAVGEHF